MINGVVEVEEIVDGVLDVFVNNVGIVVGGLGELFDEEFMEIMF